MQLDRAQALGGTCPADPWTVSGLRYRAPSQWSPRSQGSRASTTICTSGRASGATLRHYTRPALLVVDEVGYLAYDARAADLLFQLVSRRYEHRSLLITTNLPFKRWDTVFPNASCAVALIDRLTHHVEILLLEGRSYRRREAEISQQERNRQRPHRDDAPQ